MESFFRYVAYIDYYKNGEKVRNVGFLKWRLVGGEHIIEIRVKNLPTYRKTCFIKETGSGKDLGILQLEQGMSYFEKKFLDQTASGDHYIESDTGRLYLRDIHGFEIEIGMGEYLRVAVAFEEEINNNCESTDNSEREFYSTNTKTIIFDGIVEENEKKEIKKEEKALIHSVPEKYEMPIIKKEMHIMKPIPENKWDLLYQEYPKMHPFPNGREFLMIKPKDFVILRQEYQKLVNNSFLLHGFYNYGHMILGKLTEEENAKIYIGVPGVYYEREKQAAQMFGFVGFESTSQPVQQGSYGYYMIEVEI